MPAALLQHHEQREIQHRQGLSRTWNHYNFPPVIFKPQAAGPDGEPCCRSNTESFPFSSHPAEAFLTLSLLLQVEVPMGPLERHSPVFFFLLFFPWLTAGIYYWPRPSLGAHRKGGEVSCISAHSCKDQL